MGKLHYGDSATSFDLPDRTLAHVEFVVLAKLRRNEAFALLVEEPSGARQRIWIHPALTLRFEFESAVTDINREWLEELIDTANSASGMRILPESGEA